MNTRATYTCHWILSINMCRNYGIPVTHRSICTSITCSCAQWLSLQASMTIRTARLNSQPTMCGRNHVTTEHADDLTPAHPSRVCSCSNLFIKTAGHWWRLWRHRRWLGKYHRSDWFPSTQSETWRCNSNLLVLAEILKQSIQFIGSRRYCINLARLKSCAY